MTIEISDEDAREFADWLESRGQQYLLRAERLKSKYQINTAGNGSKALEHTPPDEKGSRSGTVTQEQFEQSVIKKGGRVYDIARRFKVDEAIIKGFLALPNAKIATGKRGWLYAKQT